MVDPFNLSGPAFLQLYLSLFALAVLACLVMRWLLTRVAVDPRTPLSAEEVAYLAGGPRRVALLAVNGLLDRNAIKLRDGWATVIDPAAATAAIQGAPIYRRLLAVAPDTFRVSRVDRLLASDLQLIRQTLQTQQLVVRDESVWMSRATAIVLMGLVLLGGIAKIFVGVSRNRPVSFLVMLCLATVVAFVLLLRGPSRTSAGNAVLRRLRARVAKPAYRQSPDDGQVALLGMAAFVDHANYDVLRTSMMNTQTNYGSGNTLGGSTGSSCSTSSCSSGGSSCGGGSGCGGGGCGGCGS
ncbi:MAG: hypothetical protein JWM57_3618 [Phycisphaerales bacterium]|nr:hypothetical protein [Phycisphaerales bacterium]